MEKKIDEDRVIFLQKTIKEKLGKNDSWAGYAAHHNDETSDMIIELFTLRNDSSLEYILYLSSYCENFAKTKKLLDMGINPNKLYYSEGLYLDPSDAFSHAAESGKVNFVKEFLNSVFSEKLDYNRAFYIAACKGHREVIDLFIHKVNNVNVNYDGEMYEHPLNLSIDRMDLDMFIYLLDIGVDPSTNYDGQNVFDYLTILRKNEHENFYRELLKRGHVLTILSELTNMSTEEIEVILNK